MANGEQETAGRQAWGAAHLSPRRARAGPFSGGHATAKQGIGLLERRIWSVGGDGSPVHAASEIAAVPSRTPRRDGRAAPSTPAPGIGTP